MCGYEGAAVPPACAFGLRDDARPPHEQGAGALRFGSDGAAVGADDGRPTSRGLPSAKACVERRCLAPRGQGERCRCAYSTLFAPAGQRRCGVGAPDFGLSRGGRRLRGGMPIKGRLAGAPGNGKAGRRRFARSFRPFVAGVSGAKLASRPCRSRFHPPPSRGENGGLCPHPLKGSIP